MSWKRKRKIKEEEARKVAEAKKKAIEDLLGGDVTLRSKRELIEKFIKENLPNIKDSDDVEDDARDLGVSTSQEAGWSGDDAVDGIAFTLRMNGYHKLADTIQSVIKENKSTKLTSMLKEASEYPVYNKTYTSAIEAARAYALKKGYEIEDDEMFTKVAMNSKRPGVGKTTRVSLELMRNGKPQKKMLHIQVYGMDRYGYELNTYIK